jgi:cytochrome b6-f complex iron-sulfur subunit
MAEETSPVEETSLEDTSATEQQPKFNRREILNYAWLASLGVLLVNIGGISFLFAMPRFKAGEFGGVFVLGPASNAPSVGASPNNFPKGKFWLTHPPGGVLALYKVCTHLGCLYAWRDQEGKFICPCHGSQFEYDGAYIRGPAPRSLDRFVVQLVTPDGEVVAETDPETGDPLPIPEAENLIVQVDTGRKIPGDRHG